MSIEEAFQRLVRGHLALLAVCLLLPLAVAGYLTANDRPQYRANVRVQVTASSPSSATEAEATSSRVLALATTQRLLGPALREAGDPRPVTEVADRHVTAQRLGQSSIVELSVSGPDRGQAEAVAVRLGAAVAAFMNEGARVRFNNALGALDESITAAQSRRAQVIKRLPASADVPAPAGLRSQLAALDQQLGQLAQQRSQLSVTDATRDEVVVIDADEPASARVASPLVARLLLAGLIGLLLGLAAAAALESLRPRIQTPRALARLLGAPVLGRVTGDLTALEGIIGVAARRRGTETVVLLPACHGRRQRDVRALGTALREANSRHRAERLESVKEGGSRSRRLDDAAVFGPDTPRYTVLDEVLPDQEFSAGLVVVSSGAMPRRALDELRDFISLSQWPVLGVIDHARRRWSS